MPAQPDRVRRTSEPVSYTHLDVCPPVWVVFALPLGHRYNNVPIIKFMSYLTSHIYLMVFLLLVGITPIYPVVRSNLIPYWYEWCLLVMLSGLLLHKHMLHRLCHMIKQSSLLCAEILIRKCTAIVNKIN
ncbi:hypothetical protein DBV15_01189 [Temnothorax longispinosus]|uniref:Uncharacterized protein n=1 Tax=Temnothorax longispinosus TaxID=300112 RepID=A0A4S2JB75_9HYME|nr:hypothetical protein DBV15_01189 [Temnothorax longispinosus]